MDIFRVRKHKTSSETKLNPSGTLDSIHTEILKTIREEPTADDLRTQLSQLEAKVGVLGASSSLEDAIQLTKVEAECAALRTQLAKTAPVESYFLHTIDLLWKYYQTPTTAGKTTAFDAFLHGGTPIETGTTKKQISDAFMVRIGRAANTDATQQQTEHCEACDVAREEIASEGTLVCPNCGSEEYILVVNDFHSFQDPPKERNNYAYKKINHLNEILNQFQAKESTIIPETVMNEIIVELRKRRIENVADLTEEDIRQILKKLNLSKYYEHRAHILSRLNGIPPPCITPAIEEKIRNMFQEIQAPFLLHCPNERTNFLSYAYILYKFFELLELDEYKVYFPLLKSRDRLITHDAMWKHICEELRWEFISSI